MRGVTENRSPAILFSIPFENSTAGKFKRRRENSNLAKRHVFSRAFCQILSQFRLKSADKRPQRINSQGYGRQTLFFLIRSNSDSKNPPPKNRLSRLGRESIFIVRRKFGENIVRFRLTETGLSIVRLRGGEGGLFGNKWTFDYNFWKNLNEIVVVCSKKLGQITYMNKWNTSF